MNVEKYFRKDIPAELLASLPPDPGERGKDIMEGMDSDNDGVRDDVQRAITFIAPYDYNKREAMRQLAKALQRHILSTTEAEAIASNNESKKAWACMMKVIDKEKWLENADLVKSLVINTKARLNAYFNAQKMMGTSFGTTFSSPCEFEIRD